MRVLLGGNIALRDENLAQVIEESGNPQLGIVWPDRKDILRRGFGGVDIVTVTLLACFVLGPHRVPEYR